MNKHPGTEEWNVWGKSEKKVAGLGKGQESEERWPGSKKATMGWRRADISRYEERGHARLLC